MNEQAAINVMEKYTDITLSKTVIKAHNMAINALEKQIPIEPVHSIFTANSTGRRIHKVFCAKCKERNIRTRITMGDNYCRGCGTKILWQEND